MLNPHKIYVTQINFENRVAVIDCVTLWLTNFFVDNNNDIDLCLAQAKKEIDTLSQQPNTIIIIVSNEIGMGLHADTHIGRKFTELQGWTNQYIAQKADTVVFMVAGIPMVIKGEV